MVKQLKFDNKYVASLKSGQRTSTVRIDDRGIKVGDRVQVVNKTTSDTPQDWSIPGELVIESVQSFRLDAVPMELLHDSELGHSAGREKLYELLRRFYGDHINESTVVSVFAFSFVAYDDELPYLPNLYQEERVSEAKLYADGGSRGNPGPSAAGFVIRTVDDGRIIKSWNKYLGITTNNQAEYHACIAGLEWCIGHGITKLEVYLDSMLVVNQLKGLYKVKNRDLWTLYETAKELSAKFSKITYTHIPREMNKLADKEVNVALDAVKGEDVVQ